MAPLPAFVQQGLDHIDKFLEEDNQVTKALTLIEEKTNVKKRYIAISVVVWVAGYLIFGFAASLLCSFIGFVYPAYKSVKAIESKATGDDTEWLMYWVVYASFSCLEFFSDILLSWIPFYFLLKCVFLIWCMAPVSYNGSKMIYYKLIRPWVLKNENKIDEALGFVSNNVEKLADKVSLDAASTEQTASNMMADLVSNKVNSLFTSSEDTKKSE